MVRSRWAAWLLSASFSITHIFSANSQLDYESRTWDAGVRCTGSRAWYQNDRNLFLASCAVSLAVEILRNQWRDNPSLPQSKETLNVAPSVANKPVPAKPIVSYCEKLTIQSKDQIPLPPDMQQCTQYEVHQLKSPFQIGPSCGWYMVFNAKAIEEIVEHEEPFTADHIQKKVCNHFVPLVRGQEGLLKKLIGVVAILNALTPEQIYHLAHYLQVKNYYFLETDENKNRALVTADKKPEFLKEPGVHSVQYGSVSFYEVPYLSSVLRTVKNDMAPVSHMLLSVPFTLENRHAVLVTLIKRGNKKPLLLYLDSNNSSLLYSSIYPELKMQSATVKKCIQTLDAV